MNSLIKKGMNENTRSVESLLKSSSESGHMQSLEELKESLKKDLTMHESDLIQQDRDAAQTLSSHKYSQESFTKSPKIKQDPIVELDHIIGYNG